MTMSLLHRLFGPPPAPPCLGIRAERDPDGGAPFAEILLAEGRTSIRHRLDATELADFIDHARTALGAIRLESAAPTATILPFRPKGRTAAPQVPS